MSTTDHFIPSGVIYVNGRDVGNAADVVIAVENDERSVPNFRGGGGKAASTSRITGVNLSGNFYNFSAENMALALRGDTSTVTSSAITDEAITAASTLDRLVNTANMIDITVAPVVTGSGGSPTYVENTDYTVSSAGIIPLSTGSITAGLALLIDYTSVTATKVEALTQAGEEFELVIAGLNEETNKPFRFVGYKWKPSATSGLSLLSDDYSSFPIEGELILDLTKSGAGISQYFTHEAS